MKMWLEVEPPASSTSKTKSPWEVTGKEEDSKVEEATCPEQTLAPISRGSF